MLVESTPTPYSIEGKVMGSYGQSGPLGDGAVDAAGPADQPRPPQVDGAGEVGYNQDIMEDGPKATRKVEDQARDDTGGLGG